MSSLDSIRDLRQTLFDGVSRRDFLKFMGASAALASFSGCRNKLPLETIYSVDGVSAKGLSEPTFFATTFPMPGFAQGLLVESHQGHPTKIEGNPGHPMSHGATGLFAQAGLLDLYSPFRLKGPQSANEQSISLTEFKSLFKSKLSFHKQTNDSVRQNRITALVTGTVVSPTLDWQIKRLLSSNKGIKHYTHEVVQLNAAPEVDFAELRCLVSVDWDFLGIESGGVRLPHEFVAARRKNEGKLRLYSIEPGVSLTGSKADHRFAMSTREILDFVRSLEQVLLSHPASSPNLLASTTIDPRAQLVANDLIKNRDACAVVAGSFQSPEVIATVDRINHFLSASKLGRLSARRASPSLNDQKLQDFAACASLSELCHDISTDAVEAVVFIEGNPAQTAPKDLDLASLIKRVPFSVHLTSIANTTTHAVQWGLPASHFLESWSDVRAPDGTESLVQPLLAPIFASVTAHEILSWIEDKDETSFDIVRNYWKSRLPAADFERLWKTALQSGLWRKDVAPDAADDHSFARSRHRVSPPTTVAVAPSSKSASASAPALASTAVLATQSHNQLEIIFRPDLKLWDGRYSENPWLQELPDPSTQLCWDNAVLISPSTAAEKGVSSGDIVRLRSRNGEVEAAFFIVPGLAPNTLSLTLGFGQSMKGRISEGSGFDANSLRSSNDLWQADITGFEKTNRKYEFACTQTHHDMASRDLLVSKPASTIAPLRSDLIAEATDIGRGQPDPHLPSNLYDSKEQWAMSIDTDSCTGCAVCVIACQAENNTPVVGKKMVMLGREMHWIRIDRYLPEARTSKSSAAAISKPLPVTCMHCETAPCEVVCPVQATNHSTTGLNQMVYNRCVGTRYCSNNCPYKVRRFNFYNFASGDMNAAQQRNPDVTVRSRGVMEKCTYCVQRIEEKRITARKENREIRDGEIQTACQQACPTKAITFGNLKDPKSEINRRRQSNRTYGLLTELGTRPRTTYLSRVTNFNPEVPS